MNTPPLREIIIHIVVELRDMGAAHGATKLMKLLYLIDVESYRARRETLSGLEWRFYHYGPYASEAASALSDLELDIPSETVGMDGGRFATTFQPSGWLRSRLGEYVQLTELRRANRVIKKWGDKDLNDLLDYVYFDTEPMENAKRLDVLDFSTIRRAPRRVGTVRLSDERMNSYKARLAEAIAKRRESPRRPLEPPPRFDKVYRDALEWMNAEERYSLPPGDVEITEDAKKLLSGQGDE